MPATYIHTYAYAYIVTFIICRYVCHTNGVTIRRPFKAMSIIIHRQVYGCHKVKLKARGFSSKEFTLTIL